MHVITFSFILKHSFHPTQQRNILPVSLVLNVSVHAANPQLPNNYSTLAHADRVIRLLAASLSCQYTTEIRVGKKYPLGGMVDGIRGHNWK